MADPPLVCCTLGMFIIDEIHFKPPKEPFFDVIGGAGSFFAVGARMMSPPPLSKGVGWIVDAGRDFPSHLRDYITQLDTSCVVRETPERLTTRGWNGYGDGEQRAFKYTTPKLRLDENSLSNEQLASESFHLICSPQRCIDLAQGIRKRRLQILPTASEPIFVWEPVPDLCKPEELATCMSATGIVDIISPNHVELANFLGYSEDRAENLTSDEIEELSRTFLKPVAQSGKCLVVRAGKRGCFVHSSELSKWFPSFHKPDDPEDQRKVVDTTGAGNGFLGGFTIGFLKEKNSSEKRLEKAAVYGNIAASFMIEQVGMPSLSVLDGTETWNGQAVQKRINSYSATANLNTKSLEF